jgi:uncharacterized membrane protein
MLDFVYQLLIAGAIMGVLDAVWLGVVAKKLYHDELGSMLAAKPNMVAALVFYVIFVVGVVVFVVMPAVAAGELKVAVGLGALLGLVTYATYDLTNLATLKHFPIKIVIIDLIWGMFITTVTATLTYLAFTSFAST